MSCELCGKKLPPSTCIFSTYERKIKDKKLFFCCIRCADAYEKRTRKK